MSGIGHTAKRQRVLLKDQAMDLLQTSLGFSQNPRCWTYNKTARVFSKCQLVSLEVQAMGLQQCQVMDFHKMADGSLEMSVVFLEDQAMDLQQNGPGFSRNVRSFSRKFRQGLTAKQPRFFSEGQQIFLLIFYQR